MKATNVPKALTNIETNVFCYGKICEIDTYFIFLYPVVQLQKRKQVFTITSLNFGVDSSPHHSNLKDRIEQFAFRQIKVYLMTSVKMETSNIIKYKNGDSFNILQQQQVLLLYKTS